MRAALAAVVLSWIVLSSVGALAQQAAPQPPYPPAPYAPPPGYPPGAYPPGAYPPGAYAYPFQPPPPPPPAPERTLGVGYKIGNGLGLAGADVIVAPIEHLAFDAQLNDLVGYGNATGWGYALAGVWRLKGGQQSTLYADVGFAHAKLTLSPQTGTAWSFFTNVGYEWRWDSGFGILVGAGLAHIGTITVTDGVSTDQVKGGWAPNLEAGLRYMFL